MIELVISAQDAWRLLGETLGCAAARPHFHVGIVLALWRVSGGRDGAEARAVRMVTQARCCVAAGR